MLMSEI